MAAGLLAPAGAVAQPAGGNRRPNIIFILADDMGYADMSCNSAHGIQTPNLDSIARMGINLRHAYANSAVCSASRVAIMTGRYQYRLRIGLEEPLSPGSPGKGVEIGLPPTEPTLPSLLKGGGYRTALVGKWHLGDAPRFGPVKSGYEQFFGFFGGGLDYFSHAGPNGKPALMENDKPVERTGYLTEVIGQQAVRTIHDYAGTGEPFFLSVHFNAPHWPWEGPDDKPEADRLRAQAAGKGAATIGKSPLKHHDGGSRRIYEAMVRSMDGQIGAILDTLRQRDLLDDTIIIFTSDNGGERFSDVWPFSGQKTELLEGGIRVPTLISWPRQLPRGTASDQVVMGMDWLPTLLVAAGIEPDPASPPDGINLLPALTGATPPVRRTVYWRYKANHQRAMRDGDHKYLKIGANSYLFNVVDDPLERANLMFREPEIYARLQKSWKDWNQGMLPELDISYTDGVEARFQANRIGADKTVTTADPGD